MLNRRTLMATGAAAAMASLSSRAFASDTLAPVLEHLRGFVRDDGLPFASIRIARHGEVLAEAHFSGAEDIGPQTLYRIYSMTKPVVAAGVALLVEDGRVTLETPVAEIIPAFADLRVMTASGGTEPARPMTVVQLLNHTCGLASSWSDSPVAPLYRDAGLVAAAWMYDPEISGLEGFAERLAALPLAVQPGADWVYGYGLDIAGLVIERLSGERLGDYLKRRIFEPLGMGSTGFFVPEGEGGRLAGLYAMTDGVRTKVATGAENNPLRRPYADSGSGALVSTLGDYGRFADMLAGEGAVRGVRVMRRETARLMMSPYGPQEHIAPGLARFGIAGPVGHALGGVTRLDDFMGPGSSGEYAWGGAAGTGSWSNPGMGLAVTVMTQIMPAASVPAREAMKPMIYQALAGG